MFPCYGHVICAKLFQMFGGINLVDASGGRFEISFKDIQDNQHTVRHLNQSLSDKDIKRALMKARFIRFCTFLCWFVSEKLTGNNERQNENRRNNCIHWLLQIKSLKLKSVQYIIMPVLQKGVWKFTSKKNQLNVHLNPKVCVKTSFWSFLSHQHCNT